MKGKVADNKEDFMSKNPHAKIKNGPIKGKSNGNVIKGGGINRATKSN